MHMEIINLLSFPQLKQCITEGYVTATLPISSMGELLITEGAGFIGSSLAKKSFESGWKAVNQHVFNVATQTKISLLDLIDTINQILVKVNHLNDSIDPVFGPSRKGDIQHSLADIQRMKNTFNWKPKVDLQRGLEDMIHSRKANR